MFILQTLTFDSFRTYASILQSCSYFYSCLSDKEKEKIKNSSVREITKQVHKQNIITYHALPNGKRHGLCVYYVLGVVSMEETYIDGKREGQYRIFNTDGYTREEGNYKNDKKEGLCKKFYIFDNHELVREENYKNGNRCEGTWKKFDYISGEPVREKNYKEIRDKIF